MIVFLIYLCLNITLLPVYGAFWAGGFIGSFINPEAITLKSGLELYFVALLPHIVVVLLLHIFRKKFNVNPYLNIFFFILTAVCVLYIIVIQPLSFIRD